MNGGLINKLPDKSSIFRITLCPANTATHRFPVASIHIPSGTPVILFAFKSKAGRLLPKILHKLTYI